MQSLAVLASEMDCVEEARKWFREGTRTVMVRGFSLPCPALCMRVVRVCRMLCVWCAHWVPGGLLQCAVRAAMHSTRPPQSLCHDLRDAPAAPLLCAQGRASHALWQAWALMEQKQEGQDPAMVRGLYRRGLEARCVPMALR